MEAPGFNESELETYEEYESLVKQIIVQRNEIDSETSYEWKNIGVERCIFMMKCIGMNSYISMSYVGFALRQFVTGNVTESDILLSSSYGIPDILKGLSMNGEDVNMGAMCYSEVLKIHNPLMGFVATGIEMAIFRDGPTTRLTSRPVHFAGRAYTEDGNMVSYFTHVCMKT